VHGVPSPEQIERLRKGVRLEDGRARALEADIHSRTAEEHLGRGGVAEGRQHLVKRLMEAAARRYRSCIWADYGHRRAGNAPRGAARADPGRVQLLRSQAGKKAEGPERRRPSRFPRGGPGTVRLRRAVGRGGAASPLTVHCAARRKTAPRK